MQADEHLHLLKFHHWTSLPTTKIDYEFDKLMFLRHLGNEFARDCFNGMNIFSTYEQYDHLVSLLVIPVPGDTITPQRTLAVGESITVRLVPSFTSVNSTASLRTKNNIFYFWSVSVLLNWRPAVLWSFPQWKEFSAPCNRQLHQGS